MSSTSEVEAHVTKKYDIKKRLGKGVSYGEIKMMTMESMSHNHRHVSKALN